MFIYIGQDYFHITFGSEKIFKVSKFVFAGVDF